MFGSCSLWLAFINNAYVNLSISMKICMYPHSFPFVFVDNLLSVTRDLYNISMQIMYYTAVDIMYTIETIENIFEQQMARITHEAQNNVLETINHLMGIEKTTLVAAEESSGAPSRYSCFRFDVVVQGRGCSLFWSTLSSQIRLLYLNVFYVWPFSFLN